MPFVPFSESHVGIQGQSFSEAELSRALGRLIGGSDV